MRNTPDISSHYTSGDLLRRLESRLRDDGADAARPTFEELAPYDHFHGRGIEATEELVQDLQVSPNDHILDVGSGIGGPARLFAQRFQCRVTGIDLTAEFCEVARHLTAQLGLTERIVFEQGDALAMPFGDAVFDGAYTMNVSMNIADKRAFFAEIHRVLKPGAWFRLAEIAQGPGGEPNYPTPWARTGASSFLATPAETCANLEASGFVIESQRDTAGSGTGVRRPLPRRGGGRRTAAAPRRLAGPRRTCRRGDSQHGSRAEGGPHGANRAGLPKGI